MQKPGLSGVDPLILVEQVPEAIPTADRSRAVEKQGRRAEWRGHRRYLYRAVDEHGRVVDVLLRERRDLASARAFIAQAIARRGVRPKAVITDNHAACRRAVRRRTWRAVHLRAGLHRARGETTKAIERAHVPVKDRLRATRELPSTTTGQRLLEGFELAHAVRQGHIGADAAAGAPPRSPCAHDRARAGAAEPQLLGPW